MGAVSGKEALVETVKACYRGEMSAVHDFLLKHPLETDAISPLHNHTMLYAAARNGRDDVVELLLRPQEHGLPGVVPADVNKQCGRSKSTAMHASSYYGKESTTELLYKRYGADATIRNVYGYTAVQEATKEILSTTFADLREAEPHMNELENEGKDKETNNGSYLASACGNVAATISRVGDVYENNYGEISGKVGDQVAAMWLRIVLFALQKFFSQDNVFDVQPSEMEVSWQLKINSGIVVIASVQLSDKGDKHANTMRLTAVRSALNTMRKLTANDWYEMTVNLGVPMEFINVYTHLAEDACPIEHKDVPHPDIRDELQPLRHMSYRDDNPDLVRSCAKGKKKTYESVVSKAMSASDDSDDVGDCVFDMPAQKEGPLSEAFKKLSHDTTVSDIFNTSVGPDAPVDASKPFHHNTDRTAPERDVTASREHREPHRQALVKSHPVNIAEKAIIEEAKQRILMRTTGELQPTPYNTIADHGGRTLRG